MTISTTYQALEYSGNGLTTNFSVSWQFFDDDELVVTLVDGDGVETIKTLTTHYTVTGGAGDNSGAPSTGSVTMVTAPASGETLRIERSTEKAQSTNLVNVGAFDADAVEYMSDRLMLIAQELAATILLNARGAWDSGSLYAVNDFVTNDGAAYVCTAGHTAEAANEPGTGGSWNDYWKLVVSDGSDGAAGADGADGAGLTWQGAWVTATAYAADDAVSNDGSSYICTQEHTSGASTEPGTGGSWTSYWDLLAQQGSAGAGTGDLLASNNLSDVANAATSRANLGLGATASVTFADLTLGVDDDTPGLVTVLGGGATEAGGEVRVHHAADHDTTVNYVRLVSIDDYFAIVDNTGKEAFRIDVNGDARLAASTGQVLIGVNDSVRGLLYVYGGSGEDGALVRLYQGASDDTTEEYVDLLADEGQLIIQNTSVVGLQMKTDGTFVFPQHTNGYLKVDGSGNVSTDTPSGWTEHADGEIDLSSETSGYTFGSIPSTAQEILVTFENATCASSSRAALQLGDSGGLEATGYDSIVSDSAGSATLTTSIPTGRLGSTNSRDGHCHFFNTGGNVWYAQGVAGGTGISTFMSVKTLSATLDRVNFAPLSGAFSAGLLRLFYR